MTRIVIADDHRMFIDGLKALLKNEKDINVVGEALNGIGVLDILSKEQVDIVLLDINMPEMDGIETIKAIHKNFPQVKTIILTMDNKHEFIVGLAAEGASGYILKNTGRTELLEAIQIVQQGGTFYSQSVSETIMNHLKNGHEQKPESIHLTDRETEIIKLIAEEFSTKEIAEKLFISDNTVETHRKNIMAKLNTKNVAGLVKYAIQNKLI